MKDKAIDAETWKRSYYSVVVERNAESKRAVTAERRVEILEVTIEALVKQIEALKK